MNLCFFVISTWKCEIPPAGRTSALQPRFRNLRILTSEVNIKILGPECFQCLLTFWIVIMVGWATCNCFNNSSNKLKIKENQSKMKIAFTIFPKNSLFGRNGLITIAWRTSCWYRTHAFARNTVLLPVISEAPSYWSDFAWKMTDLSWRKMMLYLQD